MLRRRLLQLFPFLSSMVVGKALAKEKLAEGHEILKSFDARDWAKHFVAHAKQLPGLATDEETMTSWFANALMRGYDESNHQVDREIATSGKQRMRYLSETAIRQAVGRGWCSEANQHKEMDVVLADAISNELFQITDLTTDWHAKHPDYSYITYPCGCKAGLVNSFAPYDFPQYCPEHGNYFDGLITTKGA